jgi:hypothetical protein
MQQQPNTPPRPEERREALPVWCNTRPRANPELDRHDLERSQARMEMVIGR